MILHFETLATRKLIVFFCLSIVFVPYQGFAADAKAKESVAAAASPPPSSLPSSDKLDVTDLEKKYWSAKDTDFSVVQNRSYSKAKRWAIAAMYGPVLNDAYSDGFALDLSVQYFLTERSGIELQYLRNSMKDNSSTSAFSDRYGTKPDFDRPTTYYGLNYNWVPIYAKMSLMNTKILYFDMAFSPGLGLTSYDQQRVNAGSSTQSSVTASINITQHFFLSNNFAIRGEFQNRWYNEDVIGQSNGVSVRSQFAHDSNLIFGIDYFF